MSTVDEIVGAAKRLSPTAFLRLRKRLDQLEQKVWEAELAKTSAEMKRRGITDREIDAAIMKRRRESRR